jgi:hypothetical protein
MTDLLIRDYISESDDPFFIELKKVFVQYVSKTFERAKLKIL